MSEPSEMTTDILEILHGVGSLHTGDSLTPSLEKIQRLIAASRNAALEEAALRMEQLGVEVANGRADVAIGCEIGAAAIRELKDK